jgi:hypothetical protein
VPKYLGFSAHPASRILPVSRDRRERQERLTQELAVIHPDHEHLAGADGCVRIGWFSGATDAAQYMAFTLPARSSAREHVGQLE